MNLPNKKTSLVLVSGISGFPQVDLQENMVAKFYSFLPDHISGFCIFTWWVNHGDKGDLADITNVIIDQKFEIGNVDQCEVPIQ